MSTVDGKTDAGADGEASCPAFWTRASGTTYAEDHEPHDWTYTQDWGGWAEFYYTCPGHAYAMPEPKPKATAKPVDITKVKMRQNDAGATTVGEYLAELLVQVWYQEQGFSGKRPFGNSGWQWDVHIALAEAGVIKGTPDIYDEGGPDEYIDWDISQAERARANEILYKVIREKLA